MHRIPPHRHRIYADSIRRFYTESGYSLRKIESILLADYHIRIDKNSILRLLRHYNIDTSKSTGLRRQVTCHTCGRSKTITRSRHRDAKGRGTSSHNPWQHYCDRTCWRVYLEEHCHTQLEARRLVETLMGKPLPPDAVAHFVDGDSSNVLKSNIKVYTSTARHLEEHRSLKE